MGKSPRKGGSGKAASAAISSPVGGKNLAMIKQQQLAKQSRKKFPVPTKKSKNNNTTRRFSLASESSLSSVSDDGRNFSNVPVFESSGDEEEDQNVEMNAIMGPSSSESGSDSDSNDNDGYSSDEDSEVDFVQLTKEKKVRAMKSAKSRKNPRKSNKKTTSTVGAVTGKVHSHSHSHSHGKIAKEEDEEEEENGDEVVAEVEFAFNFDNNGNETFKIGKSQGTSPGKSNNDDEDLGEEVPVDDFKLMDNNYDSNVLSGGNSLKNHLMMDVPKIKDDEINSDDDYEIDDDKLIATLQNDNDDLELDMLDDEEDDDNDDDDDRHDRNDDNNESEPGEELLDANEFDNLSFEGEEDIDDYETLIESALKHDNDDEQSQSSINPVSTKDKNNKKSYLLKEEENAIAKDYDNDEDDEDDEVNLKGYMRYLSDDSLLFDDEGDDDEDELGNENEDLDENERSKEDDFGFSKNSGTIQTASPKSHVRLPKRRFSIHNDERGEFHWPYMRRLDNMSDAGESSLYSSDSDEDDDDDDDDEELEFEAKLIVEEPIHSGDSTDEDTSLPKKSTKKLSGSKMVAKEVLSSSDTVPPLLGKWKASDTQKPFGIIDGLSTRSLQVETPRSLSSTNIKKVSNKPLSKSGASTHAEEPMAIDELLNMSELEEADDGDEDKSQSTEFGFVFSKAVPLSAFRNKGYVPFTMSDSMDQLKRYTLTNKKVMNGNSRREEEERKHVSFKLDPHTASHDQNNYHPSHHQPQQKDMHKDSAAALKKARKKKKQEKRMSKLRRQSAVEAAKEGLRTTKSGLFSENTIADVEAFLQDVDTGDEFSILFSGVI